jgi:hypothetical protein
VAKIFELFHLSLIPKRQSDIEHFKGTREEWLRDALGTRLQFSHYASDFHWVPQPAEAGNIMGIVERQSTRAQHKPPEEGGAEFQGVEWQGAVVAVDPTHHDDGQKLAFERDPTIGAPGSVLGSLLNYVNDLPRAPYIIEAKPLFDGEGFWQFAERHSNVVRYVDFRLVVPNMFDSAGEFDKALRRTGRHTGATKVRLRLESPDGVVTDSPEVKAGVEHSEQGGGSITAQALDGERYNSTKRKRVTTIPALPIPDASGNRLFGPLLRKVFGREPNHSLDIPDRPSDGSADG